MKGTMTMKVAVTAMAEDLDGAVDRVFGRAKCFLISDSEGGKVEVIKNVQSINAAQGAGIQAARQVADQKVDVLLTGNVGPNAFRALEAAGIKVYQFESDVATGHDALRAWKEGRLQEVKSPTAKGHGF
jgi:predicted Fe-Mo cluster-binding NifX family protein